MPTSIGSRSTFATSCATRSGVTDATALIAAIALGLCAIVA
jgi:hypothetical protein